ncbi:Pol polyprotein [Colletotrichum higginsianum IMI 349063]|uniref:Pol polyprotein n=2 Tax=Colletotrichum higginsianum (strain IMI 349063) TaxID=759273 RepID=A0A1B7XT33_COLHI|nr:Pol polyprotein [Colletotrichum higginsianum IMI 349063]OBR02925.1 Pol polyprotein [Colletotrichum higginsianum IMI 349063]
MPQLPSPEGTPEISIPNQPPPNQIIPAQRTSQLGIDPRLVEDKYWHNHPHQKLLGEIAARDLDGLDTQDLISKLLATPANEIVYLGNELNPVWIEAKKRYRESLTMAPQHNAKKKSGSKSKNATSKVAKSKKPALAPRAPPPDDDEGDSDRQTSEVPEETQLEYPIPSDDHLDRDRDRFKNYVEKLAAAEDVDKILTPEMLDEIRDWAGKALTKSTRPTSNSKLYKDVNTAVGKGGKEMPESALWALAIRIIIFEKGDASKLWKGLPDLQDAVKAMIAIVAFLIQGKFPSVRHCAAPYLKSLDRIIYTSPISEVTPLSTSEPTTATARSTTSGKTLPSKSAEPDLEVADANLSDAIPDADLSDAFHNALTRDEDLIFSFVNPEADVNQVTGSAGDDPKPSRRQSTIPLEPRPSEPQTDADHQDKQSVKEMKAMIAQLRNRVASIEHTRSSPARPRQNSPDRSSNFKLLQAQAVSSPKSLNEAAKTSQTRTNPPIETARPSRPATEMPLTPTIRNPGPLIEDRVANLASADKLEKIKLQRSMRNDPLVEAAMETSESENRDGTEGDESDNGDGASSEEEDEEFTEEQKAEIRDRMEESLGVVPPKARIAMAVSWMFELMIDRGWDISDGIVEFIQSRQAITSAAQVDTPQPGPDANSGGAKSGKRVRQPVLETPTKRSRRS